MTPKEAIQILDNLAAQAALPRREHEIAIQAVMELTKMINSAQSCDDNKPSDKTPTD